MEEENEDIDINKPSLKAIIIIVMIALFIMGFSAGNTFGYRAGYTYVKNWYDGYIEQTCLCINTTKDVLDVPAMNFLWDLD